MEQGYSLKPPTEYEYSQEVQKFKEISLKLGRALKYKELAQYELRSSRWYVKYSKNPLVTNYNKFIEYEIGMMPRYMPSKEWVIENIFKLEKSLGRAICKKDLQGAKNNTVGIGMIQHYWGTFTQMKKELGLEIVGQNKTIKERTIFSIKRDIVVLCAYILKNENRITLTRSDWNKIDMPSFQTCEKWFKDNSLSIRNYINSIGFEYLESGNGLNYYFENDKEFTKSQYELEFSKILRQFNLQYEKDYFRDIRYSTFIDNYKGMLDCDYVIEYKGRKFYIEIAGMLRDYKEWYLNDTPLNSKSKEKYRIKLKEKENMMQVQGLEYYILFPEDLNKETYNLIFK